jgi:NAD(P)-dependent dehydrogenase (short-subunit alcohol dehydrogenase family)
MASQKWLVTGANRGLGLEFVKQLSERKNITLFATARSPEKATELNAIVAANPNVHVLKLESTSPADAAAVALAIDKITGEGLDVVIANAGIANNWQKVTEVDIDALEEHFRVNVIGTTILFKAIYPLLLKRETRKFVPISTLAASLNNMFPVPMSVYGASKVALNWIAKSIDNELGPENFIAFPLNPGAVDTDMGRYASDTFGWGELPLKAPDSVKGMLKVIDNATKEQSGHFLSWDGSEVEW